MRRLPSCVLLVACFLQSRGPRVAPTVAVLRFALACPVVLGAVADGAAAAFSPKCLPTLPLTLSRPPALPPLQLPVTLALTRESRARPGTGGRPRPRRRRHHPCRRRRRRRQAAREGARARTGYRRRSIAGRTVEQRAGRPTPQTPRPPPRIEGGSASPRLRRCRTGPPRSTPRGARYTRRRAPAFATA